MQHEEARMDLYQTVDLQEAGFSGPWLVEAHTGSEGCVLPLEPGQRLTIGHGPEAALRIEDPAVSRIHAELLGTAQGVSIEDRDSRNGIRIGNAKVLRAVLGVKGGSFVVGTTTITVRPAVAAAEVSDGPIAGLVGSSAAMKRVRSSVRRLACISASVLIQGESGVGKDVVAKAIHRLGQRRGAFLPINMGGLSATLADAELFGHTRGAFTGALSNRKGAFEAAHQGTLFLDEVADMAPEIQVKLLRVLEEKTVRPLGSNQPVKVEVRVLAASWAPLVQRAAEGLFREDLYHRLATVTLALPPLRQRKSDLPELAEYLLGELEPDVGRFELASDALAGLSDYDWPGNVRELRSVLYRAALSAQAGRIAAADVRLALPKPLQPKLTEQDIKSLLASHAGNVTAAARAAQLPRSTLRDWIRRHQLEFSEEC
jgi:DNA-binding NtrC family response regulator